MNINKGVKFRTFSAGTTDFIYPVLLKISACIAPLYWLMEPKPNPNLKANHIYPKVKDWRSVGGYFTYP